MNVLETRTLDRRHLPAIVEYREQTLGWSHTKLSIAEDISDVFFAESVVIRLILEHSGMIVGVNILLFIVVCVVT